ncbi:TolC family protein, partial [Rhodoferax sp.]|uniref:TolC family protein n=1 Tax=Rhodoferax sp. TaxID=50421 RepID=UPI0025E3ECBA
MPRLLTPRLPVLTLALALAGFGAAVPASAQSLQDLYTAARGYDASYQSAKSLYDANLAKAEQAKALLLPSANFALGASRSNQEVLPNPDRSYGAQTATISASQPLYRPVNKANYDQGMKSVEAAKAQLLAAEQDL